MLLLAGVEATNAARTIHDFEHMRHTSLYVPEVKWVEKRILVMECESEHRRDCRLGMLC